MRVCASVRACVCMRVCMYVYVSVCECVSVFACVREILEEETANEGLKEIKWSERRGKWEKK